MSDIWQQDLTNESSARSSRAELKQEYRQGTGTSLKDRKDTKPTDFLGMESISLLIGKVRLR